MTPVLIKLLAILLLFFGICVLIYSLLPRKNRLDLDGKRREDEFDDQGNARFILIFKPFYRIFSPLIKYLPVPDYKDKLNRFIITAGIEREVTSEDMMGFQLTIMFIFAACGSVLFDSWLYIMLSALFGLVYPYLWVYEKKKQRQAAIRLSMPDIVDMLSLMVESGLSFSVAVQKICEIYRSDKDPFVVELYLMDQNIKLGRSREEALKIMADRVEINELDSFCSILIQANQMGANISDVLKSQADRMRSERFLKAEKLGAQASQKLLIPMMLFIFPTIFIVIFGPYLIQFILGS